MKKFLIGLTVLVVLLIVVGLVLPNDASVTRSATIKGTPDQVYAQISNLKNWEKWSAWAELDPNAKYSYSSETPEGKDAWYTWDGNEDMGKGKLSITNAVPNEALTTKIEFEGMGEGKGEWKLEPEGENTKVTWNFSSKMEMPVVGGYFAMLMDGMVGPSLETGLKNIDGLVQAMPQAPTYKAQITQEMVESYPYLSMLDSCEQTPDAFGAAYGKIFGTIGQYMAENQIPMGGAPFSIDVNIGLDGGLAVFEAGMPTATAAEGNDMITAGKLVCWKSG